MRPLGLALLVLACSGAAQPLPPFDGERALRDLVEQVRIGPRPPGSPQAEATRQLIKTRLRQAGWPVESRPFQARGPAGEELAMANLVATLPGVREERIWIGAHYDTKRLLGFLGANDGASGVAVLLELARVLGTEKRPFTVELVFFDGEEALGPSITPSDGLYGSRTLARELAEAGELERIAAFILVDMVGDRDLNLTLDRASAPWLTDILREQAGRLDPNPIDPGPRVALLDDHTPFLERGLDDVLLIIDFQFGARETPGPLWHTAGDDLSAVSAESLNRVGQLLVQALERVEERLLAQDASALTGR